DPPGVEPGPPPRQGGTLPLGDGPVASSDRCRSSEWVQWTAGESNPDFRPAIPVSSRWTSSPLAQYRKVDWTGLRVDPRSPGCRPGVIPLDQPPIRIQLVDRSVQGPPESRTRSPSLPRRHAAGAPADHRTFVLEKVRPRVELGPPAYKADMRPTHP